VDDHGCQIQLFDGKTGTRLGDPIKLLTVSANQCDGTEGPVEPRNTLRFTPDRQLVLGSIIVSRVLTSTSEREVTETLCRSVDANLTRTEWATYVPNQPYHKLCERYPARR
jgi:hypothetical protein